MKLLLIILFGASLVGCRSDADIRHRLDTAEEYLQQAPDISLGILQRIDPDMIRGNGIRAEYALLYSMALDKNGIFVESDSLIRIARDYYRRSGDLRRRCLSKYYGGLVQRNRGEAAEALVDYLGAESDCSLLGDHYLLGLLYNEIGEIYCSRYDYSNSLKYARKSYDNYRSAGKTHHCAYALGLMGKSFAELSQPDSACRYFLASLDISESCRDTAMISYTLANLALAYMADDRPEAAVAALWKIRSEWGTEWSDSEYAFMADACRMMNRPDSALYYWAEARAMASSDPQSQAQLASIAAPIHLQTGAYRQAAEEFRYVLSVQDSLARIALRHPYANLHRDYIEQRQRAAESALHAVRRQLCSTVALAVVIVLAVGYAAYANRRRHREVEAQYIAAIDDMRQANEAMLLNLEARKIPPPLKIRDLIKNRFGTVSELAMTYYEHKGANEQRAIFNKVKGIIDAFAADPAVKREIEDAVDACYDGIMAKVRKELPELKSSELDLLRYVYAGFSLSVISVFTGDSVNYTAVKKSRLKARIAGSDAPSRDLFIELMR